jgi:hypothetical protein
MMGFPAVLRSFAFTPVDGDAKRQLCLLDVALAAGLLLWFGLVCFCFFVVVLGRRSPRYYYGQTATRSCAGRMKQGTSYLSFPPAPTNER